MQSKFIELNGLPLDNTKRKNKKRIESIVLPVYFAHMMIGTFAKECLVLQTLKEQNSTGFEACGQRSC